MNKIIIALLFFPVFSCGGDREDQQFDRPNVLLIMLDDLNDYPRYLGGHPQAVSPNIDALAKEGIVFTNAHSNAPVCAPSRSSMLTGIYPHVSQNYGFKKWFKNPVLSNCKSLAAYLGENGYQTYGTGKLMHHKRKSEWTQYGTNGYYGPVAYDGVKGAAHPSVPEEYSSIGLLDGTFASLADVPAVAPSEDTPGYTGWYNTAANKPFRYVNDDDRDLMEDEISAHWAVSKLKELEQSGTDDPFLLAVGFIRPHTPLVAPQKYFDMFPLEDLQLPLILEDDAEDCFYRTVFSSNSKGIRAYEAIKAAYPTFEEGLKEYVQAYLASVAFADEQVGKVLTALRNSKFDNNTLVILTSDHGYNHGEKDFLFKNSLWEESTRTPLIIRAPGIGDNAGKEVDHPVSLIDIYPTINDYCGVRGSNMVNDSGAVLSGFSMKPFIDNPESGTWDGPDVALTVVGSGSGNLSPDAQNYSIRSKDLRYIRYRNGKEELYDHVNDPQEWKNLEADPAYSNVKAEMKRKLSELVGIEY
ncbi:MAG: sulfatase [Bacteroidota bacterium]